MKKVWALLLMIAAGVAFAGYRYLYPQLTGPQRIGQSLQSTQENHLAMKLPQLRTQSASVVAESDNTLEISYRYQGQASETVTITACGTVSFKGVSTAWGCRPVIVPAGEGSITLYYQLASSGREHECSDTVAMNFYGPDGSVFYEHAFGLEKVWHKTPGLSSWYDFRKHGCPAYS
ncbi:MAG: hypothetical protein V4805_11480 [Pseudomonadota bacterium]